MEDFVIPAPPDFPGPY